MKDIRRISYDSLYDRKVKISFKLINLLYTGVGTFFCFYKEWRSRQFQTLRRQYCPPHNFYAFTLQKKKVITLEYGHLETVRLLSETFFATGNNSDMNHELYIRFMISLYMISVKTCIWGEPRCEGFMV